MEILIAITFLLVGLTAATILLPKKRCECDCEGPIKYLSNRLMEEQIKNHEETGRLIKENSYLKRKLIEYGVDFDVDQSGKEF